MNAIAGRRSVRRARAAPAVRRTDEGRITAPAVRSESVARTALVNRLRGTRAAVVVLTAPAGYGKTNALAQWASRDPRPFAWLSVTGEDDDPASLCRLIAAALGRVVSVDPTSLDALASRRLSAASATRAVMQALSSLPRSLVLVLDDVHRLRSRESTRVLRTLAERFPAGSTLALAGRTAPRIPKARLRVAGRLAEFGTAELALGRQEIDSLARRLDVKLEPAELDALEERTEGWVAGVYLAALPLREELAGAGGGKAAAERFLADYFDFEYLAGLGAEDVTFLARTSILETMCGALCDVVLASEGSARRLEELERSSGFLYPLDEAGGWYRYHPQLREVLRAELARRESKLVPALCRRAAAWCEANGLPDAAIEYAHAAGDVRLVAGLMTPRVLPAESAGQSAAVETWLGWFDEPAELEKHPFVAVLGAWVHALAGRTAMAERWLELARRSTVDEAPPDGSDSIQTWIAVVRAAMCQDGPERMLSDAELALRGLGPASRWRPTALLLRGAALLLLGEEERAEVSFADAADVAESLAATPSRIAALTEWSLLVGARGDEERAEALALEARGLVDAHELEGYVRSGIAFAASARRLVRVGDLTAARADIERALELRPKLTHALPWLSVQTSLELAKAALALLDVSDARAWLAHANELVRRRPDLGVLAEQVRELESDVAVVAARQQQSSALTAAELRLLPFLATHLSFREIGEHLCLSRNTVKTQAISLYRKLGVSSRSAAIERAADLGLVDAAPSAADFIRTG